MPRHGVLQAAEGRVETVDVDPRGIVCDLDPVQHAGTTVVGEERLLARDGAHVFGLVVVEDSNSLDRPNIEIEGDLKRRAALGLRVNVGNKAEDRAGFGVLHR